MLFRNEEEPEIEHSLPGDVVPSSFNVLFLVTAIVFSVVVLSFKLFYLFPPILLFALNQAVIISSSRKLTSRNYDELPINHPLFSEIDWNIFSTSLRVYVNKAYFKPKSLIEINASNIFLSREIFDVFESEEIAFLAKSKDHLLKRLRNIPQLIRGFSYLYFILVFAVLMRGADKLIVTTLCIGVSLYFVSFIVAFYFDRRQFQHLFQDEKSIDIGTGIFSKLKSYYQSNRSHIKLKLFNFTSPTLMLKWLTEARAKALERKSD